MQGPARPRTDATTAGDLLEGNAGCRPRARREAGFTLLEILVALVIVMIALSTLYGGIAGGLRGTEIASQYESALSRANSHLQAAATPAQLRPGEQSGDDGGGFTWHSRTRVLDQASFSAAPPDAARAAPQAALYGIEVTISWHDGAGTRQVTLRTEREATAMPRSP